MKYAYITDHKGSYPIAIMCRILEVSRSGYYESLNRKPSKTSVRRGELQSLTREVFNGQYGIPGYRKVYAELASRGIVCSRETVRKCLKSEGLKSRVVKRKFRPKTTDSNHKNPIAENVLDRDFTATKPNKTWLADITYIELTVGFCYLAVIVDLFSRRVVGWSLAEHMRASIVVDALKQAIVVRNGMPLDILFHSDRGVQFTAADFRESLELLGISQSMSRKGNCWDNAPCESFFGKLKPEWMNHLGPFATAEDARLAVFEYIEGYYFNVRRHQGLDYRTPREVEESYFSELTREVACV